MLSNENGSLSLAGWLREFLRLEAAGGLLLIMAAALAMVVANSPLKEACFNPGG